MRYPIFKFDGNDLAVYDTPDEHWDQLESYQIEYPDILLDRDGRLLRKSDAGSTRVKISDSGAEPEPELLRGMLLQTLRHRGQEWDDDASLESLIPAARATKDEKAGMVGLPDSVSRLFRFLRLSRPKS